jgi:hypothetical protein
MDKDALVRNMAQLIAGLAVPVSLEMPLGAAGPAWAELHNGLVGFGWHSADDYEAAIRGILDAAGVTRG